MEKSQNSKPLVEWIVGGASAVLVIVLLAYLCWQALIGDDKAPNITVRVSHIDPSPAGMQVWITATNTGDRTAASVGVRASLAGNGGDLSRGEIEFDYVPAHGIRHGVIVLERPNSRAADVEVSVVGFVEP